MHLLIINGPNLNLVGLREVNIYGSTDINTYINELIQKYSKEGITITYFQSNVEGDIVNKLQEYGFSCDGIILNAGAYTHTSLAIADTVAAISSSVVELHISNIFSREDFRHVSFIGKNCKGTISGFGLKGYEIAIQSFIDSHFLIV